ncbi:MAG TPA: DUF1343 domain-containing protein [Candidatus Methylacidiphilales bacterium]|jgi:uncharacterized protein YbbC (DUF1343 family)|nr:DUF1343 domain-containing protein [Candidatus Methylacidiphilales bacterium]
MTFSRTAFLLAWLLLSGPPLQAANVKLGIDVLEENHFDKLKGLRVGLITNATGIDSHGTSTVDLLRRAPGVQLVALFGPEHGVYGSDWAGQYVESSTDPRTGLPVYSLYGPTKKPTPEMLKGIDVLVYDIQDIGCRSYTFISTLGLAMEAAGEAGIKFYVLDRPDPLNGNRVEGMMLDPKFRSFTCEWNIPYVYGLTPGELAYMIERTPGWIKKKPALTIVSMTGWYRSMSWEDTGLMWVPTSPHIPTAETALNYVATGFLGEAGGVNHGIGYTLPFAVFGHPSFNSFALADQFNQMQIPGVLFEPVTFKPFYGAFKDQIVNGAQIYYTDRDKVNLCNLAVQILYRMYHSPDTKMFRDSDNGDSGPDAFDHIAGGDALRVALESGGTPDEIITSWQPALAAFREARRPYLLYGDRPRSEPPN